MATPPSFLLAPTPVTNVFPAFSSYTGNNRKFGLIVGRVQGGGSAALPTSLTIGGQACTKEGGFPAGSFLRLTEAIYTINEAQIALLSDPENDGVPIAWSGGNFAAQLLLAFIIQDCDQDVSVNSAYEHNSVAVTTADVSLTRVADSFTLYAVLINTATVATLSNPARDSSYTLSGACISYGYETDTANTSNSSYTSSSNLSGQVAVNFAPYIANPLVVSVDGVTEPPAVLNTEQNGIVVVTANLGTVELVEIGIGFPYPTCEIVSTGANTCTINMPELYDGIVWDGIPTDATMFFWDDATKADPFRYAEVVVTVDTLDSYEIVQAEEVDTSDSESFAAQIEDLGLSVADFTRLHYPSFGGDLVIYSDFFVDIDASLLGVPILIWHVDNGTGVWNSFEVTFSEAEEPEPEPGDRVLKATVLRATTLRATVLTSFTL